MVQTLSIQEVIIYVFLAYQITNMIIIIYYNNNATDNNKTNNTNNNTNNTNQTNNTIIRIYFGSSPCASA